MTINLEIKNYPINSLIFSEYNPRQLMKDQYKHLRDSLERFGFVDPCIINKHPDRENIVIGGHQRIRIAQDLGIKEIPCVEVELDADRERELNIRLNKNVGEWDWDALANYFDVGELTEWGFKEKELVGNDIAEIEPEIGITPELYESHNYLVLYFDNDFDWQSAVDVFGIRKLKRKNTKIGDIGDGRVLSGANVLKAIL